MISKRLEGITSFIVMDVLEKAQELERQGIDVIHLEVGEPDFDTPDCVKAAVCNALEDGHTHYTHSLGMLELREAICQNYYDRYGVTVDADRVLICSGTSPAMLLLFSTLLNKGDQVIISDPHYACYPNFIRFIEGEIVRVPVYEEDGFQYRPAAIQEKMTDRTKAVFINSPSNPTGNLLSAERMEEIARISPWVISDEIYHGLVYEGKEHSILEYTDRAFVINGFSKLYAMTGWRLGYLISPLEFVRPIQKLMQNFLSPPTPLCSGPASRRSPRRGRSWRPCGPPMTNAADSSWPGWSAWASTYRCRPPAPSMFSSTPATCQQTPMPWLSTFLREDC